MLSALRTAVSELVRKITKRSLVGTDKHGNKYFKEPTVLDGVAIEKRWVEFKGQYTPTLIPVEWSSWLSNMRQDPPTPEEVEALETYRRTVKEKAAILEREEAKKRFRAKVIKDATYSASDMQRILFEMNSSAKVEKMENDKNDTIGNAHDINKDSSQFAEFHDDSPKKKFGSSVKQHPDFQPEAWVPNQKRDGIYEPWEPKENNK